MQVVVYNTVETRDLLSVLTTLDFGSRIQISEATVIVRHSQGYIRSEDGNKLVSNHNYVRV